MATGPVFQPPPTWASPVIEDEKTGDFVFNPVWLKWFLDLIANLTPSGTPTPGDASSVIAQDVYALRYEPQVTQLILQQAQLLLQAQVFGPRPPVSEALGNYQAILAGQIFGA